MNVRPRFFATALLCVALLAGCASSPAPRLAPSIEPAVTPVSLAPTATPVPVPTPIPVYADGTEVAGVSIGGLTATEAEAALNAALSNQITPVQLVAGEYTQTIMPETINLRADVTALLTAADPALGSLAPVKVPLQLQFDQTALREQLADFAAASALPPTLTVITSTDVLSRSFAYLPGRMIDPDRSFEIVSGLLSRGRTADPIFLTRWQVDEAPRATPDQIAEQLEAMVDAWDGVAGVYLYDLTTGAEVAVNARSVFAGASTIKTAIMLYAYTKLERFTERQWRRMRLMIIESDNLAANDILAAGAGGAGTDWAFRGAVEMSEMLADLGLEYLYLYVPYESADYIRLYNVKYRCGPKDPVGEPPYAETGCALRATPYAIAQVYRMIDECARGEGVLLEQFPLLNPDRCQEMLDLLAENADDSRMVAGVPAGVRVEHKSGWIEHTQADAGIVRSAGGDYALAVYVYKPLGDRLAWPDSLLGGAIADFSRLVYTAYNPVRLTEMPQEGSP
ncbi:serine hydrolase [Chloroflexus sp.]|uniref:serine hydrolase n=1 Tax=Chloroflexus sp. TaxID=1904827 RepID=UPI0026033F23|nr:serine hydrolase [uncultured Chloroflexus sp.]